MLDARREDDAAIALATVFAADPDRLGRVVRSEFGTVEAIVEAKDATDDELVNNEVNAGLYAFDADWLRRRIGSLEPSSRTGELYLTELVRLAREDGRLVIAVAFEDDGRFDGINDRSQLAGRRVEPARPAQRAAHARRRHDARPLDGLPRLGRVARDRRHDRAERDPARRDVGRGGDASSAPAARSSTRRIGRDARVWASIVESSTVEDEASVGPFSHLRPGSVVGRGAEVGNYAELKNSRLGAGVQAAPHELPRRRRDRRAASTSARAPSRPTTTGRARHRTTIGDGAFIGVDTMIVAPREIGEGARTGAGAVVTKDVPPGKLAVGVPGPDPRATPETGRGGVGTRCR